VQDNRLGMDIAQIQALASRMRAQAGRLRAMANEVTGALEAAPWRGPDRERLLDEWRNSRRSALLGMADGLEAAADAAVRSARAQAAASQR
jgi:hypothetical protein